MLKNSPFTQTALNRCLLLLCLQFSGIVVSSLWEATRFMSSLPLRLFKNRQESLKRRRGSNKILFGDLKRFSASAAIGEKIARSPFIAWHFDFDRTFWHSETSCGAGLQSVDPDIRLFNRSVYVLNLAAACSRGDQECWWKMVIFSRDADRGEARSIRGPGGVGKIAGVDVWWDLGNIIHRMWEIFHWPKIHRVGKIGALVHNYPFKHA